MGFNSQNKLEHTVWVYCYLPVLLLLCLFSVAVSVLAVY